MSKKTPDSSPGNGEPRPPKTEPTTLAQAAASLASEELAAGKDPYPSPRREPRQPRRTPDPELQALTRCDRILSELPDDAQVRVIQWLADRYSPDDVRPARHTVAEEPAP